MSDRETRNRARMGTMKVTGDEALWTPGQDEAAEALDRLIDGLAGEYGAQT